MGHLDSPTPRSDAIELPLPWGPVVRGLSWGSGRDSVLLLHEPGADIDAWGSLPALLASALGIEAVAVDLPGHGLSDDPWQPERIGPVLRLLVQEPIASPPPALAPLPPSPGSTREGGVSSVARAEGRRFVIAAGSVALAVLAHAGSLRLAGLALLSPTASPELEPHAFAMTSPPSIEPGEGSKGARAVAPKLFFAGVGAGEDLAFARRLASTSRGWTAVTAVPASERGTMLLKTPWRTRLEEEITAFLRDCRHHRPTVPPGRRIVPPPPG